MTHRATCKFPAFGVLVAALWAILAAPVSAQSIPASEVGATPGSADLSANVGWSNLEGVDGNKHINFGGAGGYNVSPYLTILGEYQLLPMGSLTETENGTSVTAHASYSMYGAATRLNFVQSRRFTPYAVVAAGAARAKATAGAEGVSATAAVNGYYVGFGGGTSWFLGRSWGIRPEARWVRQEFSAAGVTSGQNAVLVDCGLFFQWGGHAKHTHP